MTWLRNFWAWLKFTHFGILSIVVIVAGAVVMSVGILPEPNPLFLVGLVIFCVGLAWLVAGNKSEAVTPTAPAGPGQLPPESNMPKAEADTAEQPPLDGGGLGGET